MVQHRVITGNVDNSQGGRLISGATLDLTRQQVNNATGRIASQQALTARSPVSISRAVNCSAKPA